MTVKAVVAGVAYDLFPGNGDLCSDIGSGSTASGGGEKVGKVKLVVVGTSVSQAGGSDP